MKLLACGEVLVRMLEAYGIDTAFGIPGTHTIELYRGLPQMAIRYVTPRHEQAVSALPGVGFGDCTASYVRVSLAQCAAARV
jgi:glyoxylate carboligase